MWPVGAVLFQNAPWHSLIGRKRDFSIAIVDSKGSLKSDSAGRVHQTQQPQAGAPFNSSSTTAKYIGL